MVNTTNQINNPMWRFPIFLRFIGSSFPPQILGTGTSHGPHIVEHFEDIVQGGVPKIAKLIYSSNLIMVYGCLWYIYIYVELLTVYKPTKITRGVTTFWESNREIPGLAPLTPSNIACWTTFYLVQPT